MDPDGASFNYAVPSRGARDLSSPFPGAPGGPPPPPTIWPGKCVSCVARCSFADGTIYSRGIVVFKYLLVPRERDPASCLRPFVLFDRLFSFLPRSLSSCSLSLPFTDFFILRSACCTRLIHLLGPRHSILILCIRDLIEELLIAGERTREREREFRV